MNNLSRSLFSERKEEEGEDRKTIPPWSSSVTAGKLARDLPRFTHGAISLPLSLLRDRLISSLPYSSRTTLGLARPAPPPPSIRNSRASAPSQATPGHADQHFSVASAAGRLEVFAAESIAAFSRPFSEHGDTEQTAIAQEDLLRTSPRSSRSRRSNVQGIHPLRRLRACLQERSLRRRARQGLQHHKFRRRAPVNPPRHHRLLFGFFFWHVQDSD